MHVLIEAMPRRAANRIPTRMASSSAASMTWSRTTRRLLEERIAALGLRDMSRWPACSATCRNGCRRWMSSSTRPIMSRSAS